MNKFAILCIKFYQNYISKILPKSCRYYPSCSEYAVWQFKNNNIFLASFAVLMRILRCNQLFKGGIDYPVVGKKFTSISLSKQDKVADIEFWLVPCKNSKFYVIKVLDSLRGKH
ncbi:membrane protein insertion efficiency factor YidD [Campylobacter sp. RM13119]|uniref:membrane protein insertion efficiency factor YidD n=1 Tax=Campylobacter TaxID=194 RepID=UPI001473B2C7|nr:MULTISPECIES: membrane protein insertion efficiency factor YidD [unclassified Campylobacter]MBE3022170.1 membrane protein insertion efficiency factor YidD [Campylobacter sp. 7477a]MBE3605414.1 membrane protein insertion efficiency factor YidD [Campylobacter sp. RM13119]MBE3609091.1 membrane protein insertion efficiency factor YidD [Campylobacter sp. RM12916]